MESLTCPHCSKTFYNGSSKNRHIRKVHLLEVEKKRSNHIFCPLCSDDLKDSFASYLLLNQHITNVHNIIVKEENLSFPNSEAFESWMALEKRNVNYVHYKSVEGTDKKIVYYNCNRSNSIGFRSTATKRMEKKGGSIKINGVCPSRIIAHTKNKDQVEVYYVETHVGHTSSFRNQRLTNSQKEELIAKLKAGIPKRKIIEDAKIHFLNYQHLVNLTARLKVKIREGEEIDQSNLCIDEVFQEKSKSNEAAKEVISEKVEKINNGDERQVENDNEEMRIEILKQRVLSLLNDMTYYETVKKTVNEIIPIMKRNLEASCSKKRKMDEQTDFPDQKKQRRQQ